MRTAKFDMSDIPCGLNYTRAFLLEALEAKRIETIAECAKVAEGWRTDDGRAWDNCAETIFNDILALKGPANDQA